MADPRSSTEEGPTSSITPSSGASRVLGGRLGVEVWLGAKVERITANEAVIGSEAIAMRTVICAAGVTPIPVGRWLGAETDRAGRVVVTPFLHLKDDDRAFVLGDGAHVMQDGAPLPGLAPVATQEGTYVAKRIHALIRGLEPPPRFRYVDKEASRRSA